MVDFAILILCILNAINKTACIFAFWPEQELQETGRIPNSFMKILEIIANIKC